MNHARIGTEVICNGYRGTITEVCAGKLEGMVVVRVPGGTTCVSISELRAPSTAKFDRFDKVIQADWFTTLSPIA